MEIQLQRNSLVILFPHYRIPLVKLMNPKYTSAFIAKFKFGLGEPIQDQAGDVAVAFSNGLFEASDKTEHPISRIAIEDRKIALGIDGASKYADEFLAQVISFLTTLTDSEDQDFLAPLLITVDSEVVSHLNFSIDRLLAHNLHPFVTERAVRMADTERATASLGAMSVYFKVDYLPKDSYLNDRRISMVRKDLIIESTTGRLLSEQVFTSRCPFDTETHIGLLSELEALMSK